MVPPLSIGTLKCRNHFIPFPLRYHYKSYRARKAVCTIAFYAWSLFHISYFHELLLLEIYVKEFQLDLDFIRMKWLSFVYSFIASLILGNFCRPLWYFNSPPYLNESVRKNPYCLVIPINAHKQAS